MPVRALIIDDEPLARMRIRDLLASDPRVEVVGEARHGREAVAAIRHKKPGLVFLDVQMPGLDGFEVVREVGAERMPHIIFVTAYDQYALQAFEVHALDYLLKPFDEERFRTALDRALRYIPLEDRADEMAAKLKELLHSTKSGVPSSYPDRFLVKSRGRIQFLRPGDVEWAEAAGNYVILHSGREEHVLRETMKDFERKLDPRLFIRIHRSSIVNLDAVRELQPLFHGEYAVLLKSGGRLTLSRTYRQKFQKAFRSSL